MNKLLNSLKRAFMNARLRNKIIAVYVILLAVPMIIATAIFYGYSANMVEKQTTGMISNSMKQGAIYTGHMLKEIERLGDVFYENGTLQRVLARNNSTDYEDLQEYDYISGVLQQIKQNQKVHEVRLYVPDLKYYSAEKVNVFPFSEIANDPAAKEVMGQRGLKGWTGIYKPGESSTGENLFSYVVFIADLNNVNRKIGALRIDVLEKQLPELIGNIGIEGKGTWGIIEVGRKKVTSFGASEANFNEMAFKARSGEAAEFNAGNQRFWVIGEAVSGTDWLIVYSIASKELSGKIWTIRTFTIITLILMLLVSIAAAAFISDRLTMRITGLADRMKSIQGELKKEGSLYMNDEVNDEIGMLSQSYELMVEKLRRLFRENYLAQLENKENRLKLLQAQINPHFLYNVLDEINWMAVRIRASEISDMAANLGRFYRISLSKGKDVISLEQELEHVRLYTELQKYRMGDGVKYSFTTHGGTEDCKIIKLVLQPLVENAIVHGILETEEQKGEIRVETWRENGVVDIFVKDNAGLLDREKVRESVQGKDDGAEHGYGLKNVDERLKLYFGEDQGLRYYLDEAGWSVFQLRIPDV